MTRSRLFIAIISYALLLLGVLVVAVPFVYMVTSSLKPQSLVMEMPPRIIPSEITFDNYTKALATDNFGVYFLNSLFVATTATGITVVLSAMLAYAFARMEFRGKRVLFGALLLGLMIPPVMLIIPQFLVIKDLKLYNSLASLIVVYVAMNLSLQTFMLTGFFKTIPQDLIDAALIDGAGQWRIFWRLILPLSKAGLAVVIIFTFLYSWDEFPWAHVAIKEASRRTLPIAIALFQNQHLTEWGQVFAASIVALIPIVIVYIVFQRYFIAGIATTGMKS
ncbi:MAG TPA: carbohydrate ABC transporter permease [Candidatus Limnocylindrales bacterium]|jgi:ABC-type glycerol-3-phosphate transport system permease component|nr:carbohydrate ABC transporter permease [Candidatus Limnocylindrales bacterium]